ncbi:MAG: HepT-like ribonuclease domain-containing protein [Limnothrix sp.]|uniref:HepT-like ribonuclease domain-containing protein n=1 Tax=Limnothrix sp. PR1529 TaxID=1704291 RepID=UPI00081F3231|nr:HepT-like ribonuclease domain-containing protein [Limnothrix sp. PR1529]MEB3116749.1 HepT-like ribonuclease domain-containing protein [Limnothrix sp.]OCQ90767.1 hypothetical protein BCR12_03455 [Limnothrix sp. P13C2]PIB14287.1 hypothetical protein AMR42_06865 [Limnothrix sp. PR1529]
MNHDREYWLDAINACQQILDFTKGLDEDSFLQDRKTQSSVLYQITVLSEAMNRFSDSFITQNSQIPIAAIRGMRNRIIHEYREVDLWILWQAIQINIPELLILLNDSQFPEQRPEK